MFLNLRNFDVTVDVTLRVVASIHAQKNRGRNTYRVLWRHDGRQRSLTFENLPAAERFKTLLADHDPHEALRIVELDEIGHHVPTVTAWLHTHIDNLTGVQPATLARYRTYVTRDIDPVFGTESRGATRFTLEPILMRLTALGHALPATVVKFPRALTDMIPQAQPER
jgi:hypothetical protein